MNLLKQSTSVDIRIGPAVDVEDGFTPVTSLDLSTADEAELLKADGAATVDISAATMAAITGVDGWYDLTLTTAHTDTLGDLTVVIQDDSLILPIYARFTVVEDNVYDSLVAGTDFLDTNAIQISGGNPTAQFETGAGNALDTYDPPTKAELDVLGTTALATEAKQDIIDGIVDDILTDTGTTLPATLSTIDGVVDDILADTGTTLPATLSTIEGKIDTIDGVVDAILTDTGTTLDAKLDAIDSVVDAILVDTGTTLNDKIDVIDGITDAIKAKTDDLTFTKAGEVDANTQSINDAGITGDGDATPFDVV